jgi:hypothetical protein
VTGQVMGWWSLLEVDRQKQIDEMKQPDEMKQQETVGPWSSWGVLVVVLSVVGCGGQPEPPVTPEVRIVPQVSQEVRGKLLDGALAVLGSLEKYDEESAAAQVFDRLNQWIHADPVGDEAASAAWKADPLLDGLPAAYQPLCKPERLGSAVFDANRDVIAIRDQRWLADIAMSARGEALDDLDIATALFRWTIRSLAIESDPPLAATPESRGVRWFERGEILLAGRASAAQRSWIFLELLRQAGLHGVMLATVDAEGGLRPWIPALISGGEAYLFEPTYGLPITRADGSGIATARQAAADPAILDRLDQGGRPYPVAAADMQRLGVLVAADPEALSRRMALVEKNLVGAATVRLAVDATALGTLAAAALPESDNAPSMSLWRFPFEVRRRRLAGDRATTAAVARELAGFAVAMDQGGGTRGSGLRGRRTIRPLYAGRLREFRGELDGPEGAKKAYLMARPSRAVLNDLLKQVPEAQRDAVQRLYEQMKEDATYWLGVVTLAEEDYETAIDYLGRMTLEASPDGRWAAAARLNLATAKVGVGATAEAIALLNEDRSPQRFGSRLRAAELAESAEKNRAEVGN